MYASLDETLKKNLRNQYAKDPSGPEFWMMIVAEAQTDSLRRVQDLLEELKGIKLLNFPGENVRDFCMKVDDVMTQLDRDRQLPQTHLLDLIDQFTSCSVMDFKIHFMGRHSDVEKFLREATGKDPAAIDQMPNKVTYTDLLDDAKKKFVSLKSKWGPSKEEKSQEQGMIGQLKGLNAEVKKLQQQLKQKPLLLVVVVVVALPPTTTTLVVVMVEASGRRPVGIAKEII